MFHFPVLMSCACTPKASGMGWLALVSLMAKQRDETMRSISALQGGKETLGADATSDGGAEDGAVPENCDGTNQIAMDFLFV
ncbi:unnamed protein product [Amoebophrya sp. A25]|nr:unnamed protein product [Amoebophrya sp. A25]|eukprot:GSA25T00016469001.1